MEKSKIFLLILILMSILARIYIAFSTPLLIGDDVAFHLRVSEEIAKNGYFIYDDRMDRINLYPPFIHYLTAFVILFLGSVSIKIIPIILSTISIVILFFILKKQLQIEKAFLLSLIVSLSTVVIYRSLFSPPESLALGLMVLSLYLYEKEKKKPFIHKNTIVFRQWMDTRYSVFQSTVFRQWYLKVMFLLLITQTYSFIISTVSIMLKEIIKQDKRKNAIIIAALIIIAIILFSNTWQFYLKDSIIDFSSVYINGLVNIIISYPGEIILILFALTSIYKSKSQVKFAFLLLLFSFLLLHQEKLRSLSMLFFISPLLISKKLKNNIFYIIMFLVLLLIIFNLSTYKTYNTEIGNITQSVEWIKNNTYNDSVILTFGTHWITYSGRKAIIDPLTVNELYQNEKWKDVFYLTFNLTNEEKNTMLFKKYNISYVFIYNKTWNIYNYSEKKLEKMFENNITAVYKVQTL